MEITPFKEVNLPSSVTKLGESVFEGCLNLVEVQLRKGLRSLGDDAFYGCEALQQVTIPSSVIKLGSHAFDDCTNLTKVQLNEGLQVIGDYAFSCCTALQSVTVPPSDSKLGRYAFLCCSKLADVQFHEGSLQIIEGRAFQDCTGLQSVAVPSSVTDLQGGAFNSCANLTEVILLGGRRLLNQRIFDRGLLSGEEALNKGRPNEIIGWNSFFNCPLLNTIKISTSRVLSERIERLSNECRISIIRRICGLRCIELARRGDVLACFSLYHTAPDFEAGIDGSIEVHDKNNQAAESLHQLFRLISFHELKESSILIELAMWKSRFDGAQARADCRIPVPDPAKRLIMEYCGFTDFLESAIEGNVARKTLEELDE